MHSLGENIRKLREEKELPLRQVATNINIDVAILSKIERGQRNCTREQVIKLAEYYNVSQSELLIAWLSDKLVEEVGNEEIALQALVLAEEKVKYQKSKNK